MDYKWEYDNKEHEKELLKKVYAFGPLSFVFDVVWPVFWIAVSILFASFAYDEAKGYAAISLAFALILPIYINSANSFADAVYFYRKTVHFPVFGYNPLYGSYNCTAKPNRKYVFQIFEISEIKDCYLSDSEKRTLVVEDTYNGKWEIDLRSFSIRQLKYIASVIKKYAGSESGIPIDEFKKKRK